MHMFCSKTLIRYFLVLNTIDILWLVYFQKFIDHLNIKYKSYPKPTKIDTSDQKMCICHILKIYYLKVPIS